MPFHKFQLERYNYALSGCRSSYQVMEVQAQWEVYRFFRIYLISRRFFDHVRLGSISLGLDLVSDLVSMLLYLDLVNTRILTESLSTSTLRLCIYASISWLAWLSVRSHYLWSDIMPPRRKPLEQRIQHLQLSEFLGANGVQTRPVGAFPERMLSSRGQRVTQGRQKKKVNWPHLFCPHWYECPLV